MKKFFQRLFATVILSIVFVLPAHAQATGGSFSLLPQTTLDAAGCKATMKAYNEAADQAAYVNTGSNRNDVLGCGINTGLITFAMIPYYITYIANFLLGLSGLVCVLFIVLGGYRYVIGGLTEEKEKGKNTIKHALMGLGVALLSWTIVTVLINAVTG